MSISYSYLTLEEESNYESFVEHFPKSMFYWTLKYRDLLKQFLGEQDLYLIAKDHAGRVVGALPAFVCSDGGARQILNSMPFYGSHGGAISCDPEVRQGLVRYFHSVALDRNCASTTIISPLFEEDTSIYEMNAGRYLEDERVGQVTHLVQPDENVDDQVMGLIHSKTRNMVRKSIKVGVSVTKDRFHGDLDFLHRTHNENMKDIGGSAKPRRFFDLVDEIYEYGTEYIIYTAWLDGKPIAALMLFYFNGFVEYFTPVIVKEYRSQQPLSLLIYQGMVDAVKQGFTYWNWGGTWKEQEGVYRFKKSWGAQDHPYRYFTNVLDRRMLDCSRAELLEKYPYFFVLPFSALET